MLLHSIVAKTKPINATKLGIATVQKNANLWSSPLPLTKFIPKYPEMKVSGEKNTVTTAKIIMKLFVFAPTVLKIRVDILVADASICSSA